MILRGRSVNNFSLVEFRKTCLPDQQEVMAGWQGTMPVVSVVCTSYNHVRYIEDAIRGFLIQKTDFPFEIVVHDDFSTDNTRDIVNRYAAAYPLIIRTIYQKENQYSRGVKVVLHAVRHSVGEYIAVCEGDDFWISADKLQTQVDAIRKYPDCEMCFHSAITLRNELPLQNLFCRRAKGDCLFSVSPIIRGGGSFMPTASMLIRQSFFARSFQDDTGFFKKYLMGYFCQIFCSLAGGALYIDSPMAVYRSFSEGSWTQTLNRNQEFYKKWLATHLESLRAANCRTGFKYDKDFSVPLRRCHLSVLNNLDLALDFRRKHFAENWREIGLLGSLLWFGVFRIPRLHLVASRVRAFFKNCLLFG